jgi:hypothetical protein
VQNEPAAPEEPDVAATEAEGELRLLWLVAHFLPLLKYVCSKLMQVHACCSCMDPCYESHLTPCCCSAAAAAAAA